MPLERHDVVARIEGELGSVVDASLDAIRVAVPAYRDLHGPQLADVEAIASWAMRRLIGLWSTGSESMDGQDRARFRAIGAARAADGRPLTDVLRAYRVASSVFVRHVVAQHTADLEPADIAELSVVVLEAIEAISEEIIDAYTATREHITSNRDQAQAALLDDLIAGRRTSPGALADRTRELGLELPSHPHLLVVQPEDPAGLVSDENVEKMLLALGPTGHHKPAYLATRRGRRAVLLLPLTAKRSVVDATCREILLHGCLVEGKAISRVNTSFRLASDALDNAPAHAFHERSVLDEGDGQLLALLTARPTADTSAVVESVLGALTDAANEHLLEGVAAFISSGTATAAAAALHIHPQTLRYRLRRARELTGRDPRLAWDRLAFDTAIQLQHITRGTTPSSHLCR
ncbi:PucR family transcriptional regulator [Rhodococcus sp. P1Y]|uniref:PucR family transcriptional regulator n=1 Tax=Rhodococcus sp. P1Y TaxID=1302308 RepID=UPI00137A1208|nr:helix-turn-helix domain-containing protein [Rhodococcus sp. P1Y]